MWRIEASGEGKSLWRHEQLTCWRCWKTRLIDPRQVRSSSGFDTNFPDDSPLPCFVPPGWLTALIYSLLMTSKVNCEGNNIKYEPHLNMVAVPICITHLPVEFSGSRCQLRGRWGFWSRLSYSLPLCLSAVSVSKFLCCFWCTSRACIVSLFWPVGAIGRWLRPWSPLLLQLATY